MQSEEWHRFSRKIRHERPRCEMCVRMRQVGMNNLVNPSQDVHHIKKVRDYPELSFKRSNVMALCKKCHKKLTEQGK
ncbi:HNH endonuclease signature motif containing protein [Apilactobacillus timberlakei]|uniref:HNH endonuclease signature motif containing protein n=1 Tax=Apilactobacillus timberlakei TaxID=2008380 RepID=UPI001CDCD3CF|nr:HNH endonuclease signature motif containing protein [Apilactobacillus timberlakei]